MHVFVFSSSKLTKYPVSVEVWSSREGSPATPVIVVCEYDGGFVFVGITVLYKYLIRGQT